MKQIHRNNRHDKLQNEKVLTIKSDFNFADDTSENFPNEEAGKKNTDRHHANGKTENATTDTPTIKNFGTDLTKLAEDGVLDPIIGREGEIERVAQILSRRKKNNPILLGEPGVGKSALVEGLAQMITTKKVPHSLLGKKIIALDMAAIVAGTQYRGQFEERLRRIIQELKEHKEIILFIDEIHTIIGAGGAPGSLDAANILKPALARGEVQCIGATTINEYKKSIEKDGALERRFQKVMLQPTTTDETLLILKNIRDRYEEHHMVKYTDEALEACVTLTERYVTDRAFPDKAIDVMDEAGSRIRLLGVVVPAEITELEKEIDTLKFQKTEAAKNQDYELAASLRDAISNLSEKMNQLSKTWIDSLKKDRTTVDANDIAEVVSMMSHIPVSKMSIKESEKLRELKQKLGQRVISQDKAIEKIVRAIIRNKVGLKGNNRPIGTFMFVGSTGVGKTHLVKCLAEEMFGSSDALIRIDMSEYGEKYSTSRMLGAPPGYVGYEEGGQLTEKVRRRPYSIVLLDEIEKAHPDVFNTLLQVMDEGRMTDGNGTTVDFRNTIIIMTSNSGTRQLKDFGAGIGFRDSNDSRSMEAESIVKKALSKQFPPEFLNRLDDIIMFESLNSCDALQIAKLEIAEISKRLEEKGIKIEITDNAYQYIIKQGFDDKYGARSLKRAIQVHIEDNLCDMIMDMPDLRGYILFDEVDGKITGRLMP